MKGANRFVPEMAGVSDRTSAEVRASIKSAISAWCLRQPDAPAVMSSLRAPVCYRELGREIDAFGQTLRSCGLGSEARIGIALPSGPDCILALVGTVCNAVAVPLNPQTPAGDLERGWSRLGLDAVICLNDNDTAVRTVAYRHGTPILEARARTEQFLSGPTTRHRRGRGAEPGPDSIAFILQTSGTTGEPKLIPFLHRNMLAAAERMQSWFGLGTDDRCLSVAAPYYSHGLKVTVLTPLLTGGSIAVPARADRFDAPEWFSELQPTWYSASPAMHRMILDGLRASPRAASHRLRFVLSGGAPLPEQLRVDLNRTLGVPVLDHYGCSEAAQISTNLSNAMRPGTCGRPWPGAVRIVRADGSEASVGERGQILLGGPTLAPGYLSAGPADQQAFVSGWLHTGDLGSIDADGYLVLHGRASDMINRGGEKFSPYEVEAALLRHPDVAEAAVFAVPHPRLGEEVMAMAVARPGVMVVPQNLRRFLLSEIAAFKIPRRIEIVASIPKTASGKTSRTNLAAAYGARATRKDSETSESALLAIWRKLLGDDSVGPDDDFFLAGGDSLLAVAALVEIEQTLGRKVPDSLLFESGSVRGVLAALDRIGSGVADEFVRVGSDGRRPLFFFHGHNEGNLPYFLLRLSRLLGPEHPLVGIPPHGLRGESVPPSIEAMAADRALRITTEQPDGPYLIGGFCNGAMVAYETAWRLQNEGRQVDLLILVDSPSVGFSPAARALLGCLRRLAGTDVPVWRWLTRLEKSTSLSNEERLSWVTHGLARLWTAKGNEVASSEAARLFRRAEAMARYRPKPLQVRAVYYAGDYAGNGWGRLLRGLEIVPIPGGHYGALVEQVGLLATDLQKRLAI